ncbi:alpha/beta hydrolase [Pseudomonas sp. SZMC_28357]|uniref:alpha/beta hydrolase n=1 Tax=Pseudomonas sp. SZMC_28357 TaxID=3074380 RepID=UPI0028729551|nr:alpha/beta hydrolase [Pseudomonas sp. SZMC_28357]MDR9751514.1 alpha/beta hydrolase [Pseudomonas sp. SZMC_28357]
MKPHELLDPEFHSFLIPGTDQWSIETLPTIRERIHSTFGTQQNNSYEERWITVDEERLRLCIYRPGATSTTALLPVILYIHGGGFVLGRPEMADAYLAALAEELKTLIVAVDYRLAPEYPFPLPLEDCYTALGWLFGDDHDLGMDTRKIVIMGHSAGGGLAAALGILARDKGQYPIAAQVLVYPMLDHRTGTSNSPHQNESTGTFSWLPAPNRFCWNCLRGGYNLDDDRIGLFSPSMQRDLQGLPPSFISVGSLDLFLEEDVEFALRLSRAGVAVELHVYPGAPHMFDQNPGRITTQSSLDIVRALNEFLKMGIV